MTARQMARTCTKKDPLRLAVLLSGSGTNFQAIVDSIRKENAPIEIVHVVSSRPDAYGIQRALSAGIPVTVLDRQAYADPEAADALIAQTLKACRTEYIAMAGYMRKCTPVLLGAFPNRVINLHPALLPSFKGAHAIRDAYDAGVKITGITVHLANEEYDMGPIIAQEAVYIPYDCSFTELENTMHAVEHMLYPKVLRKIAEGKMMLDEENHIFLA